MHSPHVGRAFVMEDLDEAPRVAGHVPEVHEEDLALRPEPADERRKVVGHQGEVALAQRDTAGRARHRRQHPVKGVGCAHDPRHAAYLAHRRIVRMQADADPGLLGHGYHRPQEVFMGCPQLIRRDAARLGQRLGLPHGGVVVAAGPRAAAQRHVVMGARPAADGVPVVAEHSDAEFAHRPDLVLQPGDLLVTSGGSEPDGVHRGGVLEDDEFQPVLPVGIPQPGQRRAFPWALAPRGGTRARLARHSARCPHPRRTPGRAVQDGDPGRRRGGETGDGLIEQFERVRPQRVQLGRPVHRDKRDPVRFAVLDIVGVIQS
jgi:hypothetical protein